MNAIQSLRSGTARLISENHITVTIHRVEYKDDGVGGRYKEEKDLPSFIGRLVPLRQQIQKRQNEAGEIRVIDWMLVALWDANIRAGGDVEDTFIVKGKLYRIDKVIERNYKGEVYAIHITAEEMS